jgi:hypothetical protein
MNNSTDQQKRAILAIFKEPIEEVEEAFKEFINHTTSFNGEAGLKIIKLQQKINTLKAKLPTVQGE